MSGNHWPPKFRARSYNLTHSTRSDNTRDGLLGQVYSRRLSSTFGWGAGFQFDRTVVQSQDSFDKTNSNANFTNWVTLAALLVQRTALNLKLHPRKCCHAHDIVGLYCRVQTSHKGCKSKLNLAELVTFYFRDSYHNTTKGSTAFCLQTATSNSEMTDEGDPNLNYNCCLIWPRFLSNNCHKMGRGQIAGGKWWITVKRIFDRDQPYIGHSCCKLGGEQKS